MYCHVVQAEYRKLQTHASQNSALLGLLMYLRRKGGNVINIRFKDKSVIVINTQPPLHEIWVAAKSGGYHYRWAGTLAQPLWLDTKTGKELLSDLTEFTSAQAGQTVKMSLI